MSNCDYAYGMARPLRIEYPGAWYHVMNRGAGKKNIFHADKDYRLFIKSLREVANRYQIRIHAYCLMPNHYHLLLETPVANLSQAMKYINGVYTQRYNKSYKTDGPLFRGRFKSIVVDANDYLLTLSRYIHLNPVVAKLVERAEQYRWSSYAAYVGYKVKPDLLITDVILAKFGVRLQRQKYRIFIQEKVNNRKDSMFEKIKRIPVLGSDAFIKTITEKYLNKSSFVMKAEIAAPAKVEVIMEIVANYYKVNISKLTYVGQRRAGNRPRIMAIYLAYSLSGKQTKYIADRFTNISSNGVLKIMQRINAALRNDQMLQEEIVQLKELIAKSIVHT